MSKMQFVFVGWHSKMCTVCKERERERELLLWIFENITILKCWTFCKLFFSCDFPLHLNVVLFTVIILNSNTVVAALHRTLREHLSSRSSASWSVRESTFCDWKRYSRRHSRLESMLGERKGRKWVCCLKLRTMQVMLYQCFRLNWYLRNNDAIFLNGCSSSDKKKK